MSRAIESQKFIYVLHVREPGGIADDIKSIGDILYSGTGVKNEDAETRAPETEPSFFVISTILDLPLLSQVLDIEKFQIALMEKAVCTL